MSVTSQLRSAEHQAPGEAGQAPADRFGRARWGVASAAMLGVILSTMSCGALLTSGWWLGRTVVVVAVVGLVGGAARLLRVPAPLVPLTQCAALLVALTQMFARSEALWGVVPGSAAAGRLRELAAAGSEFAGATQPPAGPNEGLLLLIVAGVGLVALAVDTLAAGLDLPGMTLIPLAALFLMPWLITGAAPSGWAFAGVATGWLAILWALQSERVSRWSPRARPGSPGPGVAIAATATALAVLAGGLATLRGDADSVSVGGGAGSGPLQLDELVSIRRSLVSNNPVPILTYRTSSDAAQYLRLAVLDTFDGEQWRASGPRRFVAEAPAPARPATPQSYQFEIGPLAGSAVPSPAGTYRRLNGPALEWEAGTGLPRLVRGSVQDTSIGLAAVHEDLGAAELRARSMVSASGAAAPQTRTDPRPITGAQLPRLAASVTSDADNPFDQAVALQNWFRSEGGFTYSTAVDGGSDVDALATFLTERIGYCEQFAGTMALMARALGIPARVAIGFTPGRPNGDRWIVRGTDAHAWPELWLGTAGWVRFEPTPGATNASVPSYAEDDPSAADPTEELAEDPAETPDEAPEEGRETDLAEDATSDPAGQGARVPAPYVFAVLALGAVLTPAGVRIVKRRRRVRRADAQAAYEEIVDTVVDLALGNEAATVRATVAEVARALDAPDNPDPRSTAAPALAALARIRHAVEWQRYSAPTQHEHQADPASGGAVTAGRATVTIDRRGGPAEDMGTVLRALRHRATWRRRLAAAALPRSVLLPALRRAGTGASEPGG